MVVRGLQKGKVKRVAVGYRLRGRGGRRGIGAFG